MKALEPDPSRRYASAAELRRALRRSRLRPPLPAALAALAALAILAGLAAWSLPRRGPAPAPTVAAAAPASSPTALSGDLIVRVWSPGYDLRLMSWGDGSGVPTSGSNLVIVATDNNGLLHIRIFDASGNKVTDTAESRLPPTQAGAISALKQQLPGLLPPHVLTGAEKARLVSEATSIVGQTRSPGKDGLSVDEPGALPLRAGEQVHLEARLNRPAYAYLFWIDGQGEVSLLYPRDDGLFGSRTGGGGPEATGSVHSPDALNRGHRMTGPGGLETALLLARREPLPPGTDPVALIGRLPRAPLRDEREVAFLDLEQGGSVATSRLAQYRGIDANQVGEIDDPLLRLMERLRRSDFELIKAVRFAYRGE